jgi:hypothetical protein
MGASHRDVRKADDDGIRRWSVRRKYDASDHIDGSALRPDCKSGQGIRPDECEQQRAEFPKEWNDVSKEKPVFFCWSHYSGAFKVTLGAGDKDGRRLMSLVPLTGNEKKAKQDTSKDVFRIWLDKEQACRLEEGKYFATIVRQKGSCWIRGALSGPDDGDSDSVFFLDMANPKPDSPDAGSFYNKAP